VHILGVNAAGAEGGNAAICAGRHLPWLQDTVADSVWTSWGVAYRDVFVLDPENRVERIYNLTSFDLSVPANYDTLKAILTTAASEP
jgi:hypothetical protein